MISEEKQDLAVEYALGMLEGASLRAFEAELKSDAELRAFAEEMCESAASLAHDAPTNLPPPELRERILGQARGEKEAAEAIAQATKSAQSQSSMQTSTPTQSGGFGFLPWAIAAGLAITSAALWFELDQLKKEDKALREEAIALRNQDVLSQMKIATLSAQTDAFAKAGAVVVWDEAKQHGVVKLTNVPPAGAGKDYQLWVIDPKYPSPVNGGVVPVGADGIVKVDFKPEHPIRKVDAFAITIEKEGGAQQPAGPKVLVGD